MCCVLCVCCVLWVCVWVGRPLAVCFVYFLDVGFIVSTVGVGGSASLTASSAACDNPNIIDQPIITTISLDFSKLLCFNPERMVDTSNPKVQRLHESMTEMLHRTPQVTLQ